MNLAMDAPATVQRPDWFAWLRRELAPFPGREAMVLRLVVTVVLVTVISMSLQVPETALSAFMVFFVTKENRVLTALTGILMIVGVTIALAASLILYRFTFDYPELRIPVMALTVFTGMYLSRVFVLGPLGFAIGFIIAVTQSVAESAPNADALVRALLYLWVVIVYPIAITVVLNQILLPAHPRTALERLLIQRLDAAIAALQRAVDEGAAGGHENPALLELATRGSSALHVLLHFAEIKDPQLKRQHIAHVTAILASERLVGAAAALEMRTRQALSKDDFLCAEALLTDLAGLRTALQTNNFALLPITPAESAPTVSELREFQFAVASLRDGLIAKASGDASPAAAKAKKSLFKPDAFTNPAHTRFAFKVTLGAMSCYLLYTALDWPGIHTAFITCCFIALENTGATMRKGWLRISGCLLGGLLGFLSIMYLVPQMESIVSLVLLTAAGTLLAGWVAAGSERIAYAGLQIGFAFYMCIFQGFSPGTDFDTIRDRIVGILLGIAVSSAIFHYLWPERAVDRLRTALAQGLRGLAQLLLIPRIGAPLEAEMKAAGELRGQITKNLDDTLRLSELAGFEGDESSGQKDRPLATLENLAGHTQALCLIETFLSNETELKNWQRLDRGAQEAETSLRSQGAEQLRGVADFIEGGRRLESVDFTSAFTKWNQAQAQASEKDRTRLLRRLGEEIQQFSKPANQ